MHEPERKTCSVFSNAINCMRKKRLKQLVRNNLNVLWITFFVQKSVRGRCKEVFSTRATKLPDLPKQNLFPLFIQAQRNDFWGLLVWRSYIRAFQNSEFYFLWTNKSFTENHTRLIFRKMKMMKLASSWNFLKISFKKFCPVIRTTRININQININPNDYYNPVIDYYNPLLRFEPCLDQLGLLLILCRININQININPNIRSSNRLL